MNKDYQLQCKECGFRAAEGKYHEGNLCPKCNLSNLVREFHVRKRKYLR